MFHFCFFGHIYQEWGLVRMATGAKKVTKLSCAHNFHNIMVSELLWFLFLRNESFPKHTWSWFQLTHSIKYMKNALYLKKCREKSWCLCSLKILARGANRKLGALRSLSPSYSHPCIWKYSILSLYVYCMAKSFRLH